MKKKLTLTILFIIMLIILTATTVYANYQSIGTGNSIQSAATTWITGIRQMESKGQGMGLNETIQSNGLSTSGSNNIDVHLAKNTEYGTALLLGASDYGKQGETIDERRMDKGGTTGTGVQASTTGNKYGIYDINNLWDGEWTAGGGTAFISGIAPRYINIYANSVEKLGDATRSTIGWHGSYEGGSFATGSSGFIRGGIGYNGAFAYHTGSNNSTAYARAAVVCGNGF